MSRRACLHNPPALCLLPLIRRVAQAMVAAGKKELYEMGPGAQIKAMVKRIDGSVWKDVKNIQP